MKPCKIADDKQIHAKSKELMAIAITRKRNSDKKSGEGGCCEGLEGRNNLSFVEVSRYLTFFLIPNIPNIYFFGLQLSKFQSRARVHGS